VVLFVFKARPELLSADPARPLDTLSIRQVLIGLLGVAVLTGGALSWFASAHPDGLEWSMAKTSGHEELATPDQTIYSSLSGLQEKTAVLPDYAFKGGSAEAEAGEPSWPAVDAGTSVSGLVGGTLTLLIAGLIGFSLKRRKEA
jgi:cobalt/nickel transport system permease protein